MFSNAIHGIIETVDKIKDQKRTVFMKKEIEMEKAGFFKKGKKIERIVNFHTLYLTFHSDMLPSLKSQILKWGLLAQ